MTTPYESANDYAILERCDYHNRLLTMYCPQQNMVCCEVCLPLHKCASGYHKHIKEAASSTPIVLKDLIFHLQSCIHEENRFAEKLADDKKSISNSFNDVELFRQYMNGELDKLKRDLAKEIGNVNADANRDEGQLDFMMGHTRTIMQVISSTDGLNPIRMLVASAKTEQYHRAIMAKSNSPSYDRRVNTAIGLLISSTYPSLKSVYDAYKKHTKKTTYTSELCGQQNQSQDIEDKLQMMKLKEKQREAEASKQMLYKVYGNAIEMLEEYENRTGGQHLSKSKLALTNHSWKTDQDVKANVDGQLVVFEAHMNACPSEVTSNISTELRIKTIYWAAVREEQKIPPSETDMYIAHLYEILVKGTTHHQILDKPRQTVTRATIKQTLSHIWRGKHEAMEIDRSFEINPNQKAPSPTIRTTSNASGFYMGAKRIQDINPSLHKFLQEDVLAISTEIGDLK